jgi:hypothetical protein
VIDNTEKRVGDEIVNLACVRATTCGVQLDSLSTPASFHSFLTLLTLSRSHVGCRWHCLSFSSLSRRWTGICSLNKITRSSSKFPIKKNKIKNNSCNPGMFWTKGTQAQKYRAQDGCSSSLPTCLIGFSLLFVKLHFEEKKQKIVWSSSKHSK